MKKLKTYLTIFVSTLLLTILALALGDYVFRLLTGESFLGFSVLVKASALFSIILTPLFVLYLELLYKMKSLRFIPLIQTWLLVIFSFVLAYIIDLQSPEDPRAMLETTILMTTIGIPIALVITAMVPCVISKIAQLRFNV